jgi:hypothetical protein
MKDKTVEIYLIHPIELPPDEIYVKGIQVSLITGQIRGVYSDMLWVDGSFYFFNQGQGWVLYDLDHMDSMMVPKSNIRTIVVRK